MGSMFEKPKVQKVDTEAVEAEKRKRLLSEQRKKGRAASVLTGGQGDQSQANVARKTLIGE